MANKKPDGRLIFALILFAAGLFIRIILRSYSFIGYTLLALAFIVVYYWVMKRIKPKYPRTENVLNKIMSYAVILFCMVFAITEGAIYYGSAATEPRDTDYVIVLGSGLNGETPSLSLQYRLNTALDFLNGHEDTMCIVTGCQGVRESVSEAEGMYRWLTGKGIPADRIIKEDQARNTKENIEYSLEIIEEREGRKPETVTVVTEGFHMLRATLVAKNMGVDTVSVPARTELPLLNVNYYIREAFALWKYLIIG